MSKTIICPHCGHYFEETGWSKAGRYGKFTAEGVIKIGTQIAITILTQGKGSYTQMMAERAGEVITGDSKKLKWGDLTCPKCKKKI